MAHFGLEISDDPGPQPGDTAEAMVVDTPGTKRGEVRTFIVDGRREIDLLVHDASGSWILFAAWTGDRTRLAHRR